MTEANRDQTPLFADMGPAFERAGEARRIALQMGTPLAIWRDGRVVLIDPVSGKAENENQLLKKE